MIGSETIVAGPYTATWNSVALGIFEGDAGLPALEFQAAGEDVGNTSAYGRSVIDTVYQGGNAFFNMTCLEYKAGPLAAFWPYHATLGRMGTIGQWLYDISQSLVLTAVTGTSASAAPATLTSTKAVILPGSAVRILFGPKPRPLALRMRLFPYLNGGNPVWWTMT